MVKKLILSLFIITAVGATAIYSTRALLSDSVTLTTNTFSTGTVDLQISKNATTNYADTLSGLFTNVQDLPGQTQTQYFYLKNNGSGVDLSIAAQSANISVNGGVLSSNVNVTFTPVDSSNTQIAGSTPVSHTLADWLTTPTLLGTPNVPSGGRQKYKMDVTLDSGVTSSGTFSFDFTFTGTQVNPTPTITPSISPTPGS